MIDEILIRQEELAEYGPAETISQQAYTLVKQQGVTWPLAGANYAALSKVQTRIFDFGHFQIVAQHNPGRMRSSAAQTDARSIQSRPCFLCMQNLPEAQKGILYADNYIILSNPFPIFQWHLTIPHLRHLPQEIDGFLGDMLDLSRNLPDMVVFYNGPECGASAPDHFHFQAGNKGLLPLEKEIELLERQYSETLFNDNHLKIYAVENYLRRFVSIKSKNKELILKAFKILLEILPSHNHEPMLNILSYYDNNKWRLIIFPRAKQRPSHFFNQGKDQIIIGPAAVELGGILVLPRPEDFEKISHQIIREIFDEITVGEEVFKNFKGNIRKQL